MTTPIPLAAIEAADPTSRSAFRLLAKCVDATNRDADNLRHALLTQWTERSGSHKLEIELQSLNGSDPEGEQGAEARLAVWFLHADPETGQLVSDDNPVLDGLTDELRNRLTATIRPAQD